MWEKSIRIYDIYDILRVSNNFTKYTCDTLQLALLASTQRNGQYL